MRAASIVRYSRDLVWDYMYAPVGLGIGVISEWMNRMQYLTIRRYLSFVFLALVLLLVALALWQ
jgi:hydrogenase-4 component B